MRGDILKTSLVALIFAVPGCSTSPRTSWIDFLEQPGVDSLAALRMNLDVGSCDWGSSANERVVPEGVRHQLLDLIAAGNDQAFVAGLLTRNCFDGGDLEDLIRSFGQYLELRPKQFLNAVRAEGVPDAEIASMASSLPLVPEDIGRKLGIVSKRLALLGAIDDVGLQEVREAAMNGLKEEREGLERIGSEIR